mmetsp:Transcript_90609/g.253158  ORF Transcript_90609/g.253158 Transcript_90609/m.253158 type:complete len:235 (+) Transcript_90609:259-963(+)
MVLPDADVGADERRLLGLRPGSRLHGADQHRDARDDAGILLHQRVLLHVNAGQETARRAGEAVRGVAHQPRPGRRSADCHAGGRRAPPVLRRGLCGLVPLVPRHLAVRVAAARAAQAARGDVARPGRPNAVDRHLQQHVQLRPLGLCALFLRRPRRQGAGSRPRGSKEELAARSGRHAAGALRILLRDGPRLHALAPRVLLPVRRGCLLHPRHGHLALANFGELLHPHGPRPRW